MPRKYINSAYGTFYALGNKFEVCVDYYEDMDGGVYVEKASLVGIYLDNDTFASSLGHDIMLDLGDLSADDTFLLEEIASKDALMNGPWGEAV
jgi:hypothetical protein